MAAQNASTIKVAKLDLKIKGKGESKGSVHNAPAGYEQVKLERFSALSPDTLKTANGQLVTNVWEFSKIYNKVPAQGQTWWVHPDEVHINNGVVDKKYWAWRQKGMDFKEPVRFPAGQSNKHKFEYILRLTTTESDAKQAKSKLEYAGKFYEIMNHSAARSKVLFPLYAEAVKKLKEYEELKARVDKGAKLIIYDPSADLSTKKNGLKGVVSGIMDVTKENIQELLNNKDHEFSAGFCLSLCLLGQDSWLTV